VNTEGVAELLQVRVIYLETVMPMAKPVNKPYVSSDFWDRGCHICGHRCWIL